MLAPCLAAVPDASAQVSISSTTYFSEGQRRAPIITRAEIEVFVRVLKLEGVERRALDDLYEAFIAEWHAGERAMRAKAAVLIEEAELLQDNTALAGIHPLKVAWDEEANRIERMFLDDIATVLTADQHELLPIVEREIRRIKQIGGGALAGESVDVIQLVNQMVPSEAITPEIHELLERYSQELDAALIRRDRFIEEQREIFYELIESDLDRAEVLFDRARRLRIAVCETNERSIRRIAAALPDEHASRLIETFEERALSMYLQPTRFERRLDHVGSHARLSPEQRQRFDALVNDYRRRVAALHRQETGERKRIEREETPKFILAARARGTPEENQYRHNSGWGENATLTAIRRERLTLDRKSSETLDDILTEEQRHLLPDLATGGVFFYGYHGEYAGL